MSRISKFHLHNFTKTYLRTAVAVVFAVIAVLVISMVAPTGGLTFEYPIWLSLTLLIITPLQFITFIYPLYDGILFFDTALRLGISRKSYFLSQLSMFVILAVASVLVGSIIGDSWNGSLIDFVSMNFADQFTFESIITEVILIILAACASLLFYRFGMKFLVPFLIGLFILLMFPTFLYTTPLQMGNLIQIITKTAKLIIEYKEIFTALALAGTVTLYYFCVSHLEVQD